MSRLSGKLCRKRKVVWYEEGVPPPQELGLDTSDIRICAT